MQDSLVILYTVLKWQRNVAAFSLRNYLLSLEENRFRSPTEATTRRGIRKNGVSIKELRPLESSVAWKVIDRFHPFLQNVIFLCDFSCQVMRALFNFEVVFHARAFCLSF